MKRLLEEYTEGQCDRVFSALSPNRKRRLLRELSEQELQRGAYVEPQTLRDVLRLIVSCGLDLRTWRALKLVCRAFNELLLVPPQVEYIRQHHYEYADEQVLRVRKEVFWPWLVRFIALSGVRSRRFTLAEYKAAVMDTRNNRVYVDFVGGFSVRYPQGIIFYNGVSRGTIFHANIHTLYLKRSAMGTPVRRLLYEYCAEMKRIYADTKRAWQRYKQTPPQ